MACQLAQARNRYIHGVSKNQALSLRSQWLGELLRVARNRAQLTLKEAGEYLRLEAGSISRFERGTHPIRPSYIRDLIGFYGISDELERDRLLRLNEDAWRKDWWEGDTTDLEMGFVDYTWLEARAEQVNAYGAILLPGLLQTIDYTRAITEAGLDADQETIDRMVELRVRRQRIIAGDDPTRLAMVLEENSVRRPIGSAKVHRGQLRHLLELGEMAHIELRVLPIEAGWHAGWAGPFTVFDMPDPYPDVVYIEGLIGRTFLEEDAKVAHYRSAYDDLHRAALPPQRSRAFIETVLKDLE